MKLYEIFTKNDNGEFEYVGKINEDHFDQLLVIASVDEHNATLPNNGIVNQPKRSGRRPWGK